jgi:protein ImuB
VFRPPIPVEVTTEMHDGEVQIASIRGEGNLSGPVRMSSGPWRIESSWWAEAPAAREYWDVELAEGGVYRVFEAATGGWVVDAAYE